MSAWHCKICNRCGKSSTTIPRSHYRSKHHLSFEGNLNSPYEIERNRFGNILTPDKVECLRLSVIRRLETIISNEAHPFKDQIKAAFRMYNYFVDDARCDGESRGEMNILFDREQKGKTVQIIILLWLLMFDKTVAFDQNSVQIVLLTKCLDSIRKDFIEKFSKDMVLKPLIQNGLKEILGDRINIEPYMQFVSLTIVDGLNVNILSKERCPVLPIYLLNNKQHLKRLTNFANECKNSNRNLVILCDEVHELPLDSTSISYNRIRSMNPCVFLGVSATPYKFSSIAANVFNENGYASLPGMVYFGFKVMSEHEQRLLKNITAVPNRTLNEFITFLLNVAYENVPTRLKYLHVTTEDRNLKQTFLKTQIISMFGNRVCVKVVNQTNPERSFTQSEMKTTIQNKGIFIRIAKRVDGAGISINEKSNCVVNGITYTLSKLTAQYMSSKSKKLEMLSQSNRLTGYDDFRIEKYISSETDIVERFFKVQTESREELLKPNACVKLHGLTAHGFYTKGYVIDTNQRFSAGTEVQAISYTVQQLSDFLGPHQTFQFVDDILPSSVDRSKKQVIIKRFADILEYAHNVPDFNANPNPGYGERVYNEGVHMSVTDARTKKLLHCINYNNTTDNDADRFGESSVYILSNIFNPGSNRYKDLICIAFVQGNPGGLRLQDPSSRKHDVVSFKCIDRYINIASKSTSKFSSNY